MDHIIAYHGTSTAALPGIEREGITLAHAHTGADGWAEAHGVGFTFHPQPPSVYVTLREHDAEVLGTYTIQALHGEPVTIRLHIPRAEFARFIQDDRWAYNEPAYRIEGNIPPEWVDAYRVGSRASMDTDSTHNQTWDDSRKLGPWIKVHPA